MTFTVTRVGRNPKRDIIGGRNVQVVGTWSNNFGTSGGTVLASTLGLSQSIEWAICNRITGSSISTQQFTFNWTSTTLTITANPDTTMNGVFYVLGY